MCRWLSCAWGPAEPECGHSPKAWGPGAGGQLHGHEDPPLPSEPSRRRHLQGTDSEGSGVYFNVPLPGPWANAPDRPLQRRCLGFYCSSLVHLG